MGHKKDDFGLHFGSILEVNFNQNRYKSEIHSLLGPLGGSRETLEPLGMIFDVFLLNFGRFWMTFWELCLSILAHAFLLSRLLKSGFIQVKVASCGME